MDIQAATIPADDDHGPDIAGLDVTAKAGLQHCLQLLGNAGLRPTRQRLALGQLLFLGGHRHVTAESLYEEAMAANTYLSLATVYNTLNQFTEAGLLRELAVSGAKSFFDTRTSPHHHFWSEADGEMADVPAEEVEIARLPTPPEGMEIAGVEVMIRLRPRVLA